MRFCDIRNNQGRGKCSQPKPKAEAEVDNTYRVLLYIVLKKITTKRIIAAITVYFQTLKNVQRIEKPSYFAVCELDIAVRALDIALGNHALRAQPTDYSLICRYRLVNNL